MRVGGMGMITRLYGVFSQRAEPLRSHSTYLQCAPRRHGTPRVLTGCLQCAHRRHLSTDPSLLAVAVPEQMWGRGEPSVGADVGQG